MPFKVTEDAESLILRFDTTTKKRVTQKLAEKTKEVRDLARRMAPLDRGNLEEAIKMRPDEGDNASQIRNVLGQFVKREYDVYVDMDMPIEERPGKTIGDYAYEMHEHLTPVGPKNLGLKSEEKQEENPDIIVGGGYLTRALDEIGKDLIREIGEIVFGENLEE